ncbi:UNVERIFIED_CONTAM: hypothetical protein Slati_0401700 [Sesamum latifolium]|uniref:Uncharacterized protein n=1 Tax=Sesamum latifolium TaxID=2727402 RepID=A0AAW2XVV1_9LAMI
MEGTSGGEHPSIAEHPLEQREQIPVRQEEQMVLLTHDELQRMIEAANRNAIVEYERRMITPVVLELVRK